MKGANEIFVDSNVFIRLLSKDDEEQSKSAARLFELAERNELHLLTGPPVFFEVAWVLRFSYRRTNAEIIEALEAMLAQPNLKVLDRQLVASAIELARESNQGFADAYIAATARGRDAQVATFNEKHFAKLGAQVFKMREVCV